MKSTFPSPIRVLIVEEEERLRTAIYEYFRKPGYAATMVDNAKTALRYLQAPPDYDLVLLDLGLPGISGFELLEEALLNSIDSSFLVMSGLTSLQDRLRAFRLGAEDFLVKPFDIEELEARMEAIIARRRAPAVGPSDVYESGGLTIDFGSRTCLQEDSRVPLTSLEFDIIEYLVEREGEPVSREELRAAIWDEPKAISIRTVDRHIAKIRAKLEQSSDVPRYLRTVRGKGYEFRGPSNRVAGYFG